MKGTFRLRHFFFLLALFVTLTIVLDLIRISRYQVVPRRLSENIDLRQDELYWKLVNGSEEIRWEDLDGTLEYISSIEPKGL